MTPFPVKLQMSFMYVSMQSEMETAVPAPQTETEATKPDVKKRVPLTTIANAIPAKIKWEKKLYYPYRNQSDLQQEYTFI